MKKAVVTISIGDEYKILGNLLHPSKFGYSHKVGADFIEINVRKWPDIHPNFEKLQIRDVLDNYDRVLYLDCDTLIRRDTPDLFEIVPESCFAAYNESWWGGWGIAPNGMTDFRAPHYGVEPVPVTRYFNSGVMLIPKAYQAVFDFPPNLDNSKFTQQPIDQPWINLQLVKLNVPICELPYTFNRTHSVKIGKRTDAYIIHYNAMRKDSGWVDKKYGDDPIETIKKDIAYWEANGL
jgi:hypothetical protein